MSQFIFCAIFAYALLFKSQYLLLLGCCLVLCELYTSVAANGFTIAIKGFFAYSIGFFVLFLLLSLNITDLSLLKSGIFASFVLAALCRYNFGVFSFAILFAAWLGCFAIPLDWNVGWKVFPMCSLIPSVICRMILDIATEFQKIFLAKKSQ